MKNLKLFLATLVFAVIYQFSYSQLSLGGQASFLKVFGGLGLNNIGIGIKGEYAKDDKVVFLGGFNYYLASKFSDFTYGRSLSSMTIPSQIEVDVEYSVSFIHLYGGAKKYFVGDYEDDFGFYGIAEAGLLMAPIKTTVGDYNPILYYTAATDGEKETLSNFTINVGVGIEKELDFGYLFGDLKFNIPANKANGQTVSIEIPASFSINAGVRIPFK